jgi:DNA-binding protein HU-beta
MKKEELVRKIATNMGETLKDSERFLNGIFETIKEEIKNGEEVKLYGFGTLKSVDTAERKGRNPQTQEEMVIPASKRVVFRAAEGFKKDVKANA